MQAAAVKVEAEYRIPIEHHNPMEPHAAIAVWQGDTLSIFDKTQNVYDVRADLAVSFGIPEAQVNVISPFVGGAFGASLRPHYCPALTAMAARELRRPVKLVYTRTQMFTGHGYRPYTIQRIALGADRSGKLSVTIHQAVHNTSTFEDFSDDTTGFARQVYACPSLHAPLRIVPTDLSTPTWMRAPGAVSGMFALECAMDELAYALRIDPLQLRLINYAETDPESGRPFSSKRRRREPSHQPVVDDLTVTESPALRAAIGNEHRVSPLRTPSARVSADSRSRCRPTSDVVRRRSLDGPGDFASADEAGVQAAGARSPLSGWPGPRHAAWPRPVRRGEDVAGALPSRDSCWRVGVAPPGVD
jgi:xanthine dehydrogenase molybdopterin-binding subunit B